MWKRIFDKLETDKLNPYPPGQYKGECEERYVVVKDGTVIPSIQSNKLGQKVIDIILFVPVNSYLSMEPYAKEIRLALKELKFLRKTGSETPVIEDNEKKAYTMSIQYVIMKKLEG